jgi:hypothetical protein
MLCQVFRPDTLSEVAPDRKTKQLQTKNSNGGFSKNKFPPPEFVCLRKIAIFSFPVFWLLQKPHKQ